MHVAKYLTLTVVGSDVFCSSHGSGGKNSDTNSLASVLLKISFFTFLVFLKLTLPISLSKGKTHSRGLSFSFVVAARGVHTPV